MSKSLPIYNSIIQNLSNAINISEDDKQHLITQIESYTDTHELIFAIIRCYQINNSNDISNLPFYGKYLKTKKCYKFDLNNIPDKLIQILIDFYTLHIQSVENK